MSKLADYRARMLARKAEHAGVTVAELLRRSEAEALITRRSLELRYDRRSGWPIIAAHAAGHGRSFVVDQ